MTENHQHNEDAHQPEEGPQPINITTLSREQLIRLVMVMDQKNQRLANIISQVTENLEGSKNELMHHGWVKAGEVVFQGNRVAQEEHNLKSPFVKQKSLDEALDEMLQGGDAPATED